MLSSTRHNFARVRARAERTLAGKLSSPTTVRLTLQVTVGDCAGWLLCPQRRENGGGKGSTLRFFHAHMPSMSEASGSGVQGEFEPRLEPAPPVGGPVELLEGAGPAADGPEAVNQQARDDELWTHFEENRLGRVVEVGLEWQECTLVGCVATRETWAKPGALTGQGVQRGARAAAVL